MAKRIILALSTLFLTWLIINYSLQTIKLWQSGEKIEEKKNELSLIEEKNKELSQELEQVQSQEFIEKEAREKLGLGKEGERVVIMPPVSTNLGNPDEQTLNEPNWQKWWQLFAY